MADLWPAGTATGTGSMPGSDAVAAAKLGFDTLALPFLPELPDRGAGADLIPRGAGLLSGLYVDLQPSGWRLVQRPGTDSRRIADFLARDLDALEQAGEGWTGPLKLQACGPWTLAAGLEMMRGGLALADRGAVADLAESLAEGYAAQVAEVRRRLPKVTAVFAQLDEPSISAVAAGRIRTASGFSTLRTPELSELAGTLRRVTETLASTAGAVPGVHSCAADPPVRLFTSAGARWVSIDLAGNRPGPLDEELGEAWEAGVGLVAGVVPDGRLLGVGEAVAPVRALARRLGMSDHDTRLIAVSPSCGLPGRPFGAAKAVLERCVEVAKELDRG